MKHLKYGRKVRLRGKPRLHAAATTLKTASSSDHMRRLLHIPVCPAAGFPVFLGPQVIEMICQFYLDS